MDVGPLGKQAVRKVTTYDDHLGGVYPPDILDIRSLVHCFKRSNVIAANARAFVGSSVVHSKVKL